MRCVLLALTATAYFPSNKLPLRLYRVWHPLRISPALSIRYVFLVLSSHCAFPKPLSSVANFWRLPATALYAFPQHLAAVAFLSRLAATAHFPSAQLFKAFSSPCDYCISSALSFCCVFIEISTHCTLPQRCVFLALSSHCAFPKPLSSVANFWRLTATALNAFPQHLAVVAFLSRLAATAHFPSAQHPLRLTFSRRCAMTQP